MHRAVLIGKQSYKPGVIEIAQFNANMDIQTSGAEQRAQVIVDKDAESTYCERGLPNKQCPTRESQVRSQCFNNYRKQLHY